MFGEREMGVREAAARALVRDAPDCSGAMHIAVTEMARSLDLAAIVETSLRQRIERLEARLDALEASAPRPPAARWPSPQAANLPMLGGMEMTL